MSKTYQSDDPKNPMPYRSLGNSGLKVSQFSLGGWTTFGGSVKDQSLTNSIIQTAFHAGVNFFDIADVYANGESEKMMGIALKEFPRHHLVISSKTFWPMSKDINDRGLSRKHVTESLHQSLKRIGTDYLDIYFCHRFDPETPLEETIRAMDDLIRQGKILYWGTSEWTAEQLEDAHRICTAGGYHRPQVEQPQYNLLVRTAFEDSVAPMAHHLRMGLVVWSPLASGILTGKYDNGVKDGRLSRIGWLKDQMLTEKAVSQVKAFKKLADSTGYTRTQLALAWTANHRYLSSVILGATSLEQLKENLTAMNVKMSPELYKEIANIFI